MSTDLCETQESTEKQYPYRETFRCPILCVQLIAATYVAKGYSEGTKDTANLCILFEANHKELSGPQTIVLKSKGGFWSRGDCQHNHFDTPLILIDEGASEIALEILHYRKDEFQIQVIKVFLRRDFAHNH